MIFSISGFIFATCFLSPWFMFMCYSLYLLHSLCRFFFLFIHVRSHLEHCLSTYLTSELIITNIKVNIENINATSETVIFDGFFSFLFFFILFSPLSVSLLFIVSFIIPAIIDYMCFFLPCQRQVFCFFFPLLVNLHKQIKSPVRLFNLLDLSFSCSDPLSGTVDS